MGEIKEARTGYALRASCGGSMHHQLGASERQ